MTYSLETLLEKLISFQTDTNHPAEMQKCLEFVKKYLIDAGLKVKTYKSNNIPSLVAAKTLKKHYQYILNGHLDVVPAEYPNAFKAVRKGNRMYGRGSGDMKGSAAVMMNIMKDLSKKNVDVAIMLTFDEEIGGNDGVKYLLNKEKYSCDCAIIPDGGNNFHLTLNQKGSLHVTLQAKGESAHGSRPWLGDNAVEKLIEVYSEIKQSFPISNNKDHWETTVNLGKFAGGSATNTVASAATMSVDFRYVNESDKERVLTLLRKLEKTTKGLSFEIDLHGYPMAVSPKNKYIKRFISTAKEKGIELVLENTPTGSDGRYFTEKNIPVIMTNPNCSKGHTDDEWVDMKSLVDHYSVHKAFLLGKNN